MKEPHFIPGNRPAKPLFDTSDQPLDFQPKSTFGHDQHKQFMYSHVGSIANEGVMDQNAVAASVHAWNSMTVPVATFPPIPLAPSGTQVTHCFFLSTDCKLMTFCKFLLSLYSLILRLHLKLPSLSTLHLFLGELLVQASNLLFLLSVHHLVLVLGHLFTPQIFLEMGMALLILLNGQKRLRVLFSC